MSLSYKHQQNPNRLEKIIWVIQEGLNMRNQSEKTRKNKALNDDSQNVRSIYIWAAHSNKLPLPNK
jgi:hypothetical protein